MWRAAGLVSLLLVSPAGAGAPEDARALAAGQRLVHELRTAPEGVVLDCIWPECAARIARLVRAPATIAGPEASCGLGVSYRLEPGEACASLFLEAPEDPHLVWRLTMTGAAKPRRDGTWDWEIDWASLIALPKVSF
ncbi:hypothetical protein [Phenylobacterium sp.]|uniref:hypothetical protein n=1 Tax=Phenylobacterium sp. TaxID=1871053 RepID=UPI002FE28B45